MIKKLKNSIDGARRKYDLNLGEISVFLSVKRFLEVMHRNHINLENKFFIVFA